MELAFHPGTGADCRDGRIARSHYDWRTSRVAVLDGRVVSHFGVYNLVLRVGISRAKTAGVQLVATHPDHERRGYMGRCARASLEAMAANAYALSVICNAEPNLYARYGYVYAWPETAWTVKTEHLPAGDRPELTEFKAGTRPDVWELYNRQHVTVTGTAVRPTYTHLKTPNDPGRGFLWTSADGTLAGFVVVDKTDDLEYLWHQDSAGDPQLQLRVLGHLARDWGCKSLRVTRQPYHGPLIRALRRLTCTEENRYAHDGRWMARVIDPARLLSSIGSELTRRLRASQFARWSGQLTIHHFSQTVVLTIASGDVRVDPAASPSSGRSLRADAALAQLALGARTVPDLLEEGAITTSGNATALVEALFPEQRPMLSNGDL